MVGGYQIIDLNDFELVNGSYYPKKYFKPDVKKPVRVIGLKGKSTNNPDLENVSVWKEFRQVYEEDEGIYTSYLWDDETQFAGGLVGLTVLITDFDYSTVNAYLEGRFSYPIYCSVQIREIED